MFGAGLIISLIFLVLTMAYRPYCTDGLNQLQICSLVANVFTLFVGIMLIISSELEDASIRAGEEFDARERDIISALVFIVNILVIGFPIVQEIENIFDFFKKAAKAATSLFRAASKEGKALKSTANCNKAQESTRSLGAGVQSVLVSVSPCNG